MRTTIHRPRFLPRAKAPMHCAIATSRLSQTLVVTLESFLVVPAIPSCHNTTTFIRNGRFFISMAAALQTAMQGLLLISFISIGNPNAPQAPLGTKHRRHVSIHRASIPTRTISAIFEARPRQSVFQFLELRCARDSLCRHRALRMTKRFWWAKGLGLHRSCRAKFGAALTQWRKIK